MTTWAQAFSDAMPIIVTTLAAPIAGLIGAVLWKIAAWIGYKATAQQKATLEGDIETSLKAGAAKVLPEITKFGWDSPQVRALLLDEATKYLKERFPAQAAKIENAADAGGSASMDPIGDTLDARVNDVLKNAAESPATPPAPPPTSPAQSGEHP